MRKIKPGINWIWYHSDTKEEAEKWYKELTGNKEVPDWMISQNRDGSWCFRIHR